MIRNFYDKALPIEDIKKRLHSSAISYSSVCDKQILFIYRDKSKDAEYRYYETFYKKENFIHLVGCTANKSVGAERFYEICLATDDIPSEYITFKESRAAASSKLRVFESLFNFKYVKVYEIGEHDKYNEKNSFQMGVANTMSGGVIGFYKYGRLPIPITVLANPLSEYSTACKHVLATLIKGDKKYDKVIGCVKSGLAVADLPKSIQDKIYFPNGIIKQ